MVPTRDSMSAHSHLSSDALFKQMLQSPTLAMPTVLLCFGLLAGIGATWHFALAGALPMWAGCVINGFLAYGMFSIAHDGLHRAISSVPWVNEPMGAIGLFFLLPYAPLAVARWVHMQHHRFTNGELDPDRYIHDCPRWQMLLRWSNFDVFYFVYFLKHGDAVRDKHLKTVVGYVAVLVLAILAAVIAGYGYEILMLWLLPTRIALFLVASVFVYLPHYPGVVPDEDDAYLATTMRMGWEWLLTPLLVYHNYHLIHHLYPTVPFYKMHDVWHLKYDELTQGNVSYQSAFGMEPDNIELHRKHQQVAANPRTNNSTT